MDLLVSADLKSSDLECPPRAGLIKQRPPDGDGDEEDEDPEHHLDVLHQLVAELLLADVHPVGVTALTPDILANPVTDAGDNLAGRVFRKRVKAKDFNGHPPELSRQSYY